MSHDPSTEAERVAQRSAWIDVTRPLQTGMIHWPGDRPFVWRRSAEIGGPGTCNVSEITTSVHVGTHIDAPLHFIAGGADIDQIPLDRLCGPAVVVEVPAPRDVERQDLERTDIEDGERVLFKTTNGALWARGEFDAGFVGVSGDAARWLVRHNVPAVGIDYLSVDRYDSQDRAAHYALLGAGIPVIEGLDLSAVGPGRYEMVALPLRISGSDGSPARVILRSLAASGQPSSR